MLLLRLLFLPYLRPHVPYPPTAHDQEQANFAVNGDPFYRPNQILPARQLPAHRTMAQARRLCNIVLVLFVLFVHVDVPSLCTADTTRVSCLRPWFPTLLFYVYILLWIHGVILEYLRGSHVIVTTNLN